MTKETVNRQKVETKATFLRKEEDRGNKLLRILRSRMTVEDSLLMSEYASFGPRLI